MAVTRYDTPGRQRQVQDTLELLAERESITLLETDKPNIIRLAHKLANNGVLEGRLGSWFDCFASIHTLF